MPEPYRLDYELRTGRRPDHRAPEHGHTAAGEALDLSSRAGRRELDRRRRAAPDAPGRARLRPGLSPLTNFMPARRSRRRRGRPRDGVGVGAGPGGDALRAALRADRRRRVRFIGLDADFTAELELDEERARRPTPWRSASRPREARSADRVAHAGALLVGRELGQRRADRAEWARADTAPGYPRRGGEALSPDHLRVPDERARLRADEGHARVARLRGGARRDDADLILFNTCSIREKADNRLVGHLGEAKRLKREDPERVVGVGGCWSQSMKDQVFEQFPFVDVAFGPGPGAQARRVPDQRQPDAPRATSSSRASPATCR